MFLPECQKDFIELSAEVISCFRKEMVVMDGIVMGPTHGCTGALANACGHGESFCTIHRNQFQNRCHVHDCQDNRINDTQACQEHHY
jgi:hypothetical protein